MSAMPPNPLPYATPLQPAGRPIVVAVWIGIFGLALAVIGGCFLVGVLIMHENAAQPPSPFANNAVITATLNYWTPGRILFVTVLYICALISFLSAAGLMILSVRRLLRA